jgi:hypothetical protein
MNTLRISILLILIFSSNYVHAKAGFLSFGGEEIIEAIDLPNDERFQTPEGEYVNIGYIYKSVAILYIPIWNYDGRLVGTTGQTDTYLNLPQEQIEIMIIESGKEFPQMPLLDFWHRIGGKTLFLIALGFISFNIRKKMKKKSSFLSPLPTARERLKDILINSQEFTELEPGVLNIEDKDAVLGLEFIAVKNYFNSFISVSLVDMNKVTIEQVQANNDDLFERLLPLKKAVSSSAQASLHYVYFTFDKSPSNDDIAVLKSLKKRKIRSSTNVIPAIIDFEKMKVDTALGAMPSKTILENCFIQAQGEELHIEKVKI